MNNNHYAVAALGELKNNVLLLSMGNDHLTDDVFLTKIGKNISRTVDVLRKDIPSLKKGYPGKFLNDVETDSILDRISDATQRMLKPGKEIKDAYASGALGKEMESYLAAITKAVNEIRMKVHGTPADHAEKGMATGLGDAVKGAVMSAGSIMAFALKVLACVIVLAGAVYAYLFFTMEKDTVFVNEIASSQASIKEKKEILSKLTQERQGLSEKRDSMKDSRLATNDERITMLDLENKVKKLDDTIEQTEIEISVQEKKIVDNQEKLEAFKKKPFIKKLLKQ
jgi:hypothetical protein